MSRPLRSTPITRASPLLRAGPPAGTASVLNVSGFRRTTLSLSPTAQSSTDGQYRHPPSHVPCRSSRSGSRHLHAGHRLANQRASARLIPETLELPGSDVILVVSTLPQRFAHARLPDPHLTHHVRLFLIAHHDGHQPTQHEAV